MRISGGISGVCSSDLSFSTTGIGLPSFAGGKAMLAAEIEPADAPGRRRSARAAVPLDARIDRGGLGRALCRVVVLSVPGARLETYSALRRGSTTWFPVPHIRDSIAVDAWAPHSVAASDFHTPLPQATFNALGPHYETQRQPIGQPGAVTET